MGLFFNHKCKICRTRQPNYLMHPSGMGWICRDCERTRNLDKRDGKTKR